MDNTLTLSKDEHIFSFESKLPTELPSSFEGTHDTLISETSIQQADDNSVFLQQSLVEFDISPELRLCVPGKLMS